jgi:hypothetical protein
MFEYNHWQRHNGNIGQLAVIQLLAQKFIGRVILQVEDACSRKHNLFKVFVWKKGQDVLGQNLKFAMAN